jgi:cation diffusion facilitator family transporter
MTAFDFFMRKCVERNGQRRNAFYNRLVAQTTTQTAAAGHLQSGARLALLGIVVNAVLATVKILSGVLGHSYALIADGFESTLDIVSSLIMWGGLKYAARPPDESHPYGHGKAEPIAAITGSLTLVAAAALLSIESIREIVVPHHAPAPFTLIVLVVVVLVKEMLSRAVDRVAQQAQSTAMAADALHHRSDALTSGAAFIGISIALFGKKTGRAWESADDWAALFACVIIAWNGARLLKPALYDLMDTAPPREMEDRVRSAANSVAGVAEVEQCRIRKTGLQYYVDLHVGVDGGISVREGHAIAHQVKDAVRNANPAVADVLVHIEPADACPE